jgi:transposase
MSKQLIFKQSLGLDVSKDSVSVCFAQEEDGRKFRILSTHKFACSASGFAHLDTWIKRYWKTDVVLSVLMEATGVYYESVAYFLREKAYRVSVALPNKTKAYAKSLGYKSKTDSIDARMLAQMALERQMAEWTPPGKNMLTIKRLCRERVELIAQKTAASNRLHAKDHSHTPESSSRIRAKKLLEFLQKQIADVEAAIKQAVYADAQIREKVELVCTIKGVAIITAATIIGETNGFALVKNKAQLVSYAGYDVVENESGTSLKGKTRISKKGNPFIRRALHFPALTALKHNPSLKSLYDRVVDRTKVKMKGAVAVQRKLLVLIFTLYRKNQAFDPFYSDKPVTSLQQLNRQKQLSVPA